MLNVSEMDLKEEVPGIEGKRLWALLTSTKKSQGQYHTTTNIKIESLRTRVTTLCGVTINTLVPLCGTRGSFRDGKRSCHNLYDAYLAVLIYNPLESTYNVHCVSDKPENILAVQKTFMPIPAGCIPYHRLLTWRAKKSLSEFNNAEINTTSTNVNRH